MGWEVLVSDDSYGNRIFVLCCNTSGFAFGPVMSFSTLLFDDDFYELYNKLFTEDPRKLDDEELSDVYSTMLDALGEIQGDGTHISELEKEQIE